MAEVSLRQIAERIGCSRATVSYALRNRPHVSEAMREKVIAVATEMGWEPDAALAKQMALVRGTIASRSRPKLAVAINKAGKDLEMEIPQRMQLNGAVDYARAAGFDVDVFRLMEAPMRPERFKSILEARGVEGVVFIGSMYPEIPLEYLRAGIGFACSVTGIRYPDVPFHVVVADHMAGGRLIVENLRRRGYRRPAVIVPRGVDEPMGYAMTGGITCGTVELPVEDQLVVQHVGKGENHIPEYEFDRMVDWLEENRPDCLLSTDIIGARALLNRARERVGEIALYSWDWIPEREDLGGLDQKHRKIGEAAVDLVVSQIHRGECGLPEVQQAICIEGNWVEKTEAAADRK